MNQPSRTPVYHPQNGRQVGYIEGNTFYQTRQETGIIQRPRKAIAFAAEHLNLFHELRVVWINVRVPPALYVTTVEQFKKHGEKMQRGGKEPQYKLDFGWWSINGKPPKNKLPALKPEDYQYSLIDKS